MWWKLNFLREMNYFCGRNSLVARKPFLLCGKCTFHYADLYSCDGIELPVGIPDFRWGTLCPLGEIFMWFGNPSRSGRKHFLFADRWSFDGNATSRVKTKLPDCEPSFLWGNFLSGMGTHSPIREFFLPL